MTDTINHFIELSQINLKDKIEKKGKFSYVSWAYAVDELMKADPTASWEIHEPKFYQVKQSMQAMVSCTVTAFGKPIYMFLPVMTNNNAPLNDPSVCDINKAQMRCLVKAIACHGLGLYIYAGEDLPLDDEPQQQNQGYQNQNYHQSHNNYQQPNYKESLTPERFSQALQAVKTGNFNKNNLLNDYQLTNEQIAEVHALGLVA